MEVSGKAQKNGKDVVFIKAYKGDAMSLLAFDLDEELREDLAGFTILYKYEINGEVEENYMFNRLVFPEDFLAANAQIPKKDRNSTLYSPIQKFNWVHVPNTNINTQLPIFGEYEYFITPRYIKGGKLLDLDDELTATLKIDVSPFDMKNTKLGFTRGFVSSVAYVNRFGLANNKVRPVPDNKLLFDITQKSGTASRWNDALHAFEDVDYSFEEQHKWLGWQARQRIMEFLDDAIADPGVHVKAFIYDLDEPEICKRLLTLAGENRIQITLDNDGKHEDPAHMEMAFDKVFRETVADEEDIQRGHFNNGLAHSKVFIQLKNDKAFRVLTGSTNFSTNGLYINSNHVIVFDNPKIAQLYSDVFDASFGPEKMLAFKGSEHSMNDHDFDEAGIPGMTITFAPHTKPAAQRIFTRISERISRPGNTDILFAVMNDTNNGNILDAVRDQVQSAEVFTYGITDKIGADADYTVYLYKPNNKRGVRIRARGISNVLPPPLGQVPNIDGYAIHHKFIVVNFKGDDPVVYCGSSNLALGPEQKNGDNLLEIRDKDIVTAFAIEALRLVDHFHWRNNELSDQEMKLDDLGTPSKAWYKSWFNENDLHNLQRELYIRD